MSITLNITEFLDSVHHFNVPKEHNFQKLDLVPYSGETPWELRQAFRLP
jgi:hypothetical protein